MVNKLLKVGERFRTKYKLVNGAEFYGHVLDIPDTSRVSNFLTARRYLRTNPFITNVFPSCVVNINGEIYIVGDHGTGFYFSPIYKHFKLFEVDKVVDWYKVTKTADPVTSVNKTNRVLQSEKVYLSTQPKGVIEDSLHIPQQTFLAISNKEVSRNDIVDGKIVTKVDYVLGCWLLELKEE